MNISFWIIEYFSSFTEILLGYLFCKTFVGNAQASNQKTAMVLLSLSGAVCIIYINYHTLFSQATTLFASILFVLLQFALYYKKPIRTLLFSFIYLVLMALIDAICVYSIAYIVALPLNDIILSFSLFRLAAIIFSKSLLFIIVYSIYKLKADTLALPKKYLLALAVFSVFMFTLLHYIVLKDIHSATEELSETSVLFFLSTLILILVLFVGIIKISEYQKNSQYLALLEMQNSVYQNAMIETEKTFSHWKTSLHDYKHNIFHLVSLAERGAMNEINEYLAKENKLLSERLFYYQTGNNTVDALLYAKQTIANDNGISFSINASLPKECHVSDFHLCVILGNLIDNAINASKNEELPFIDVSIKQVKNFLVFRIINRFTPDNSKRSAQNFDSHLHGIGLKSVAKTTMQCNGEFDLSFNNEQVIAKVMILNNGYSSNAH
ncbi:MAG: GHKL domain-containing protein [Lachnospiraceae bacterium]|jgi:hypothetical protein|nr:GHKL domain-containing protein [Lachnospiraceae bacterium]